MRVHIPLVAAICRTVLVLIMNIKNKKVIIQNFIVPILLIGLCFLKANKGIDLSDAGYNIDYFQHYEDYSGQAVISIWGSILFGHLLTALPGGNSWLGITLYCQCIWCGLALTAYYFCKRYFNAYMVAISEALAILYCWNPSVVLYDYLSFFLFQIGIILLIRGLEKESWKYMLLAGVTLGVDVFVRIPNVVYCATIGIVWGYAFWKKREWKWTLQRTLTCIAGYGMGMVIPLGGIIMKYGWQEFKIAIYNLFVVSESSSNYGIGYMATATLRTIFNEWCNIKLSWNPTTATMLPITSFILLIGILACLFDLFISKDTIYRVLDLTYLGVLYVTPLGSNNGVYLSMLNMFLLLPIEIAAILRVLKKISIKSSKIAVGAGVCCGMLALILGIEIVLFGVKFTWKDAPVIKIDNPDSYLNGMQTSTERAEELQNLEEIFYRNGWKGRYGILYCDAPGLAPVLNLKPIMLSQWSDWYTYTDDNFEKGIIKAQQLVMSQEEPIVILNKPYYEVYEGIAPEENTDSVTITEKYYMLAKFLRDNGYECMYSTDNYKIYICEKVK